MAFRLVSPIRFIRLSHQCLFSSSGPPCSFSREGWCCLTMAVAVVGAICLLMVPPSSLIRRKAVYTLLSSSHSINRRTLFAFGILATGLRGFFHCFQKLLLLAAYGILCNCVAQFGGEMSSCFVISMFFLRI